MLILVWIIVVAGIVANVVLPKKNPTLVRDINFGFGILGLWPIVCNYPILASEISMGKPAMWLVIFAPITLDIGMIFFGLGKKKPGMHTAWHVFAYLALAMEIVAVYYYSIALAQQIAQ
jgi:channel protein (hemolysin III family)